MTEKLLIEAREVALRLGVSLRKLEYLISEGNAPEFIRIGRTRKWRRKDVDDWLDKLFQQSSR